MSFDGNPAPQAAGGTPLRISEPKVSFRTGLRPRIVRTPKVAARRADGSLICLSDLPDPGLRWTRMRKAAVVECVEYGLIRLDAVRQRYNLSTAEFSEWQHARAFRIGAVIWTDRPRRVTEGAVTAGSLQIDLDRGRVRTAGRSVDIAPSEWRLLSALAEADGAIVTNAMLMGVLYARAEDAAGPKIADVLICRLRKKLGEDGSRIASVWGRGYFLAQ